MMMNHFLCTFSDFYEHLIQLVDFLPFLYKGYNFHNLFYVYIIAFLLT